jgi:DNA-binding NarL/FixJ family response regulator
MKIREATMKRSLLLGEGHLSILVVDALELRRAGVVSLLRPWTDANELQIVEASSPAMPLAPTLELGNSYKMILLIVGFAGVSDSKIQSWIKLLASRYVGVPLVLISDRDESTEVVAALESGVSGFVPTTITPTIALQAFAFIMSGGSFFPAAALAEATRTYRPPPMTSGKALTVVTSVERHVLTLRQKQVLERLTEGASNKLIGRQLKLRESTVKVHIRHIMKKLGATNRTQAALCAMHLAVSTTEPERSNGEESTKVQSHP